MDPLQQGHLVHSSVDGRGAGALECYIYILQLEMGVFYFIHFVYSLFLNEPFRKIARSNNHLSVKKTTVFQLYFFNQEVFRNHGHE